MVDQVVPARPARILDVAAGTAGVTIQLAGRTAAYVVGIDLTEAMLRQGQGNVAAAGLTDRIALTTGRAEQLPFPDATFDALTFTYLLRYVSDPAATLRELVRVLRPGAPMANLEFLVPSNPFWHSCWWLYTRVGLPRRAGWPIVSGTRSDGSSDRTSRRTTASTRSPRPSPCGAMPA